MVINKEVSQQWLFLLFFAKIASPIMKGVTKMRAFIIGFIKGFASVALVLSSIINIFSIGGATGIIAAIFNTIILVSVWLSIKD
jgi:hypothetical protein